MPHIVPIEVFNIARTQVVESEVLRWLAFIGVSDDFKLPADGAISNPALLVALAAKRCYKSFEVSKKLNPNLTRVRKDWCEYLDNVMKSGHGSVLEHAVYTFAIENVSRVFTGEMNRHRAGWAISEGSMRYIRYTDIPYWLPTSISGPDVLDDFVSESFQTDRADNIECVLSITDPMALEAKKHASRDVFARAFRQMQENYGLLQTIWKDELAEGSNFVDKKHVTSMMRRIIGMGVASGGIWSGNIRALRHVMALRCSPAAEEEILLVFSRVAKFMVDNEPALMGDFTRTPEGFWVPKYPKV